MKNTALIDEKDAEFLQISSTRLRYQGSDFRRKAKCNSPELSILSYSVDKKRAEKKADEGFPAGFFPEILPRTKAVILPETPGPCNPSCSSSF